MRPRRGILESDDILAKDSVRNLQLYLSPEAEHILDWFNLSMRITVIKQTTKGLPIKVGEGDEERDLRETALKLIESVKWYLWHGNVFQALEQLEFLGMDLESADFESPSETARKLLQAINEFHSYIERNRAFIPNYGERYRNSERIGPKRGFGGMLPRLVSQFPATAAEGGGMPPRNLTLSN